MPKQKGIPTKIPNRSKSLFSKLCVFIIKGRVEEFPFHPFQNLLILIERKSKDFGFLLIHFYGFIYSIFQVSYFSNVSPELVKQ